MKVQVFQSSEGDCLLVEGSKGRILIDGGMAGSYLEFVNPALASLREKKQEIDLVCISHIDEDHISGILALLQVELEWRRFARDRKKKGARPPKQGRPAAIREVWHNGFSLLVPDNAGDIRDTLTAAARALTPVTAGDFESLSRHHLLTMAVEIASGVKQAAQVSRLLSAKSLDIPLNKGFGKKLVLVRPRKKVSRIGSLRLTLLAPFEADVVKLRDEWNKWLGKNKATVTALRRSTDFDLAALGHDPTDALAGPWLELARRLEVDLQGKIGARSEVTAPNLASIMFHLAEGKKTALFTGDGHVDDLKNGLERAGLLKKDASLHVDLFKVPHHGAEFNSTEAFAGLVTADHYVFCANGSHKNPDKDIVDLYLKARLDLKKGPRRKFTLWFNSASTMPGATANNRKQMAVVEKAVASWKRKHPAAFDAHFFTQASRTIAL